MAGALDNQIAVGPLLPGASVVKAHGLSFIPDLVWPDRTTPIVVTNRTLTTVTFKNNGPATASAIFIVWRVHSVQSSGDQGMIWQGSPDQVASAAVASDLIEAAPRWTDLMIPDSSIRNGVTAPALTVFKGATRLNLFAAGDEVEFVVQMPHSWKLGTAISPHVHCSFPNTNAGAYVWGLEYTIAQIGGVFGNTTILETLSTAAPGVAFDHNLVELNGDIDMSGALAALSTMIVCRLYRKTGVAGAYASGIYLLEFDFHYQMDTLGSTGEFVK